MEFDTNQPIPWEEVIKKEARGTDNYDLGEVQQVTSDYVLTQKGIVDKKWFQIPKHLAKMYDGSMLTFGITETEAKDSHVLDEPPSEQNQEDSEMTVPLIEEKLEPTKREITEEAAIIKEPVKETQNVDVQLTHE